MAAVECDVSRILRKPRAELVGRDAGGVGTAITSICLLSTRYLTQFGAAQAARQACPVFGACNNVLTGVGKAVQGKTWGAGSDVELGPASSAGSDAYAGQDNEHTVRCRYGPKEAYLKANMTALHVHAEFTSAC